MDLIPEVSENEPTVIKWTKTGSTYFYRFGKLEATLLVSGEVLILN